MSEPFPVCVASKGRANRTARTLTQLAAEGVSHYCFVEPHEYDTYATAHPAAELVEIGADDQGLGYVRQFILDWAREQEIEWYWMVDDDISKFARVIDRRVQQCPVREVLCAAQQQFATDALPNVAQAALEYAQFAWSAGGRLRFNSYCDVAVAIHAGRTGPIRFRTETGVKVDRDFTLQLLANGRHTVRTTEFCFVAPKNGSNKGGLFEVYQQDGREAEASRKMVELWPGVCKVKVKRDGRVDAAVNWRVFSQPIESAVTR